ncbi:MAG TPA: class I SAM-dependent methyltransferase [Sphingopyxis sp.]|jgi:SAM-dependent methyltransferase|uniref:class I SAM-dependent methyltransferase n=1 Tax=Sphingopyxis sp. TaxID=1908224 RepID=UPI002E2FB5F2|nr:class I SAM-dependent methyltransferase [Sphingopyxis sp.]HEX2813599.1 class I SAM-dependent methyltransferase [Sphingopyxis sp.]
MWNAGYVSEVDYIYGYFSELAPVRLKFALLSRGISHDVGDRPNYLELGFGQGLSLNINAATSSGSFYGTDFNPSQAAYASQVSRASGKALSIFDDSFEEFARRDLPQFDIIALHGIWSWVSGEARDAIVEIARTKLKPGGILYISYNCKPGWAPIEPLRHLLNLYAAKAATGGLLARVEESLHFVRRIVETNAGYFAQYPAIGNMVEAIGKLDRNYVSHEYFNRHWLPESFSEVSERLAEAKLDFAASASLIDNMPGLGVPAHCHDLLAGITDPALYETTRDYLVNRQFRRDIFVKGKRQMTTAEIADGIEEYSFLALNDAKELPLSLATAAGSASLREEIYKPVWKALMAKRGAITSFGALAAAVQGEGITRTQLAEVLFVLTGRGDIAPAAQSATPEEDLAASVALNQELCRRSKYGAGANNLAAPRIGAAVTVSRVQQLILLALSDSVKDVETTVWDWLSSQGERLVSDGKPLETPEENIEEIRKLRKDVSARLVPLLRRLGAVPE